ncbi:MAG: AraC family ligand binding domain-containing protein, partial [Oscillospiraceae bacterium]|nr:AraC family ligand binding domain-containing protein [Oscillospiraceae bacterium]
MNNIIFNNVCMPVLNGCDLCAASESFYHADRTIGFNVLIYVIEGTIYVTEDNIDYAVNAGELLFLKSGVRHFGKREVPKGTRWYFVHFYFSEQPDLEEFVPNSTAIQQYEPVKFSKPLPKYTDNLSGSRIEIGIASLIEYFHSDDRMKKWNINSALHKLLMEIAMYTEAAEKPVTLSDKITLFL